MFTQLLCNVNPSHSPKSQLRRLLDIPHVQTSDHNKVRHADGCCSQLSFGQTSEFTPIFLLNPRNINPCNYQFIDTIYYGRTVSFFRIICNNKDVINNKSTVLFNSICGQSAPYGGHIRDLCPQANAVSISQALNEAGKHIHSERCEM